MNKQKTPDEVATGVMMLLTVTAVVFWGLSVSPVGDLVDAPNAASDHEFNEFLKAPVGALVIIDDGYVYRKLPVDEGLCGGGNHVALGHVRTGLMCLGEARVSLKIVQVRVVRENDSDYEAVEKAFRTGQSYIAH